MFIKNNTSNSKNSDNGSMNNNDRSGKMKSVVPSIISSDVQIIGDIISDGEIHFDGYIEGNVKAEKIIITENAIINGDIKSANLEIRGEVNGKIDVESIHLASTAKVVGDINYVTLDIEKGAIFEGKTSINEKSKDLNNATNISDVTKVFVNDKKSNIDSKRQHKKVHIIKG